MILIVSKF